jgi:hypothetical protein
MDKVRAILLRLANDLYKSLGPQFKHIEVECNYRSGLGQQQYVYILYETTDDGQPNAVVQEYEKTGGSFFHLFVCACTPNDDAFKRLASAAIEDMRKYIAVGDNTFSAYNAFNEWSLNITGRGCTAAR